MKNYLARGILASGLLGAFVFALAVTSAHSAGITQKRTAEIVNSGSTNFAGYRIVVHETGHVKYVPGKGRAAMGMPDKETETDIPADLAKKFFADLQQAAPLSKLPVPHCMKSASFGTVTTVKMGGQQSPDLSCSSQDRRMNSLSDDVDAVTDALKSRHSR